MYYIVDKDQLRKLEKGMHQTAHIFQFVPLSKHEARANANAKFPFTNTISKGNTDKGRTYVHI